MVWRLDRSFYPGLKEFDDWAKKQTRHYFQVCSPLQRKRVKKNWTKTKKAQISLFVFFLQWILLSSLNGTWSKNFRWPGSFCLRALCPWLQWAVQNPVLQLTLTTTTALAVWTPKKAPVPNWAPPTPKYHSYKLQHQIQTQNSDRHSKHLEVEPNLQCKIELRLFTLCH